MSEEQTSNNGKDAKPKTEYETVIMEDGREVKFPGKRQLDRSIIVDSAGHRVTARFDFRNGKSLSISSDELAEETVLQALGHGFVQKIGDETAGVEKIEDQVLGCENMIERLKKGEWQAARAAGDSFSGASVVIRAICEVTKKTPEAVKEFLAGKLEKAKAAGEKLTRKELYDSFRNINSPTGVVIQRLEAEDRAKATKADAGELLSEMEAL